MIFNEHLDLEGSHAFLGASKPQWLGYDEETLLDRYTVSRYAQFLGTTLHEIAANLIKYKMKLTKNDKKLVRFELEKAGVPSYCYNIDDIYENLMNYVNDAIGFRLQPEKILVYSKDCYGTADAIDYKEREKSLKIFDYKSGKTPADMRQLLIYAALFYLEYKDRYRLNLEEMSIELRIYQNCEILCFNPTVDDVMDVVNNIVYKNQVLTDFKERGV